MRYRLFESLDETNNSGGLIRSEEPLVRSRVLPSSRILINQYGRKRRTAAGDREVRFLQFRYWSGTNWLDSWNASVDPLPWR